MPLLLDREANIKLSVCEFVDYFGCEKEDALKFDKLSEKQVSAFKKVVGDMKRGG